MSIPMENYEDDSLMPFIVKYLKLTSVMDGSVWDICRPQNQPRRGRPINPQSVRFQVPRKRMKEREEARYEYESFMYKTGVRRTPPDPTFPMLVKRLMEGENA